MKELAVYFSFFKDSALYLIVASLIGLLGGYFIFEQQQTVYKVEAVYELQSAEKSGEEKLLIAEEVVGIVREQSVQQNIGISDVEDLYISRIGPFSVKVISTSNIPQHEYENLNKLLQLINERGSFVLVGNFISAVENPSIILFLSAGFVGGFGVGLCIALMKKYLKSF